MDFKSLKSFQTIVKHGSFIQAAKEMNYSQSTVTMQIKKLEREIGVQLIERGKKIQLTEAGKFFFEQSSAIMERVEQLQTDILDLYKGEAGTVRVGVDGADRKLPASVFAKNICDAVSENSGVPGNCGHTCFTGVLAAGKYRDGDMFFTEYRLGAIFSTTFP